MHELTIAEWMTEGFMKLQFCSFSVQHIHIVENVQHLVDMVHMRQMGDK